MAPKVSQMRERSAYRLGSPLLIALLVATSSAEKLTDSLTGTLVTLVIGLPTYFVLVWATYLRLRDAALSRGWVMLMVVSLNVGPHWRLSDHETFHLSGLVALIPVIMAWLVPHGAGANPPDIATDLA